MTDAAQITGRSTVIWRNENDTVNSTEDVNKLVDQVDISWVTQK